MYLSHQMKRGPTWLRRAWLVLTVILAVVLGTLCFVPMALWRGGIEFIEALVSLFGDARADWRLMGRNRRHPRELDNL